MTANQINYAKVLEDQRHNRVSEDIERSKAASMSHQAESARINAVQARRQVDLGYVRAGEDERSHRAQEIQKQYELLETQRHNTTLEDINKSQMHIAKDRQIAEQTYWTVLGSVAEHNAESQRMSAQAALMHGSAALSQSATSAFSAQETARHNLKQEAQARNLLAETTRHDYAIEALNAKQEDRVKWQEFQRTELEKRKVRNEEKKANISIFTGILSAGARALG